MEREIPNLETDPLKGKAFAILELLNNGMDLSTLQKTLKIKNTGKLNSLTTPTIEELKKDYLNTGRSNKCSGFNLQYNKLSNYIHSVHKKHMFVEELYYGHSQ